jgi:Polysaccharide pyruvyl transferase
MASHTQERARPFTGNGRESPVGAPDPSWTPPTPGRLAVARSHFDRLGYLAPLRRQRGGLAYVGWLGFGNAGDEALFDAFRLALPHRALAHVSHERLLRMAASGRLLRGRVEGVLLGGGTLIGHETFRRHTEWLLDAAPGAAGFAVGTGVLDPDFPDRPPGEAELELERWRPLLHRLERVSVRGPRSRELLERLGVEAPVVGDPALLLRAPAAPVRPRAPVLGLNIGFARNTWGGDPERLLRAVVGLADRWLADGGQVELFPVWAADLPLVRAATERIAGPVRVVPDFGDVQMLLAGIARCHVFVGMKLHSVVLAAAAGVPGVMIEYHPKCGDFQASIGRERYTVRTDELHAERLAALTFELAGARDRHAADLESKVADRRAALVAELRAIDGR